MNINKIVFICIKYKYQNKLIYPPLDNSVLTQSDAKPTAESRVGIPRRTCVFVFCVDDTIFFPLLVVCHELKTPM
jgi:hypothetical protein